MLNELRELVRLNYPMGLVLSAFIVFCMHLDKKRWKRNKHWINSITCYEDVTCIDTFLSSISNDSEIIKIHEITLYQACVTLMYYKRNS